MWTRVELKNKAKAIMSRSYGKMLVASVLASLAYGVVNIDIDTIIYDSRIASTVGLLLILLGIFAVNPITVGANRFFILNSEGNASLSEIFSMFKMDYWNVVKVMLMMQIKTILWTLCLVVPGIIKGFEYSMIPYLLAENSSMSMSECFSLSKEMTSGQKMDMFVLDCSFVGWYILAALACGIGIIFVGPYVMATETELYKVLKPKEELPDLPL